MLNFKSMILMFVLLLFVFLSSAYALQAPKRTLNGNMSLTYNQLPGEVSSISEMFTKGMFYGRLRINSFRWDYLHQTSGKDNWAAGFGGSLIYKSAYFYGFGMTAGLYTSQNPWHMSGDEYKHIGAGRDVFSRYKVATGGGYGMTVLAQAYLEYRFLQSNIRVGRQIFESFLTHSNDTKMIPNTFQGVSFESSWLSDTVIKAAWFNRQKLRDHVTFHHVLAYDGGGAPLTWTENDDSAMHQGLTLAKLDKAGINDQLIVFQVENKSIPNLSVMANYTGVPQLVESATGEANYTIPLMAGFKVIPGVRYMRQFDDGGGSIGGASLKDDTQGYRHPKSLDGGLFAARIKLKKGVGDLMVGYSKVADDADLVAPWRGFPSGGYTRAMGQYNWYANTESWMLQADYDFAKAGLIPGFSTDVKYAVQNFDDKKPGTQADSNVLNINLEEKIPAVPGLSVKARFNFVRGAGVGSKKNPSDNEYRLEMNYLF